ncbi:slipin family protein [Candidatus Gracilibacteria bacterium]|nr:slipin family protein [Candidatus Gracilibacteria bacterium]MCF7856525.1 slipin family protein [Candidatus Gracilibacteria bacterium]MCF7896579.1 slipin family protein [Candidatus Gracilibacteria bacterium]
MQGISPLFSGLGLIPIVIVLLVIFIRQVNQFERGILFTFGKYSKTVDPGWRIVIPVFQSLTKVDIRVKAVDVPDQEAMTKDNVSVRINAVIYYKVKDAAKVIIEVENFRNATAQLAQTTMRNVVGEVPLDDVLGKRDEISKKIRTIVDVATDPWGIDVINVELKDIGLNDEMKRVMGKEAEAEREKRAVIIKAEGEVAAAENMAKAAKTLSGAPGALHLRTLQSVNDLSSDQSNTTVWMLPVEALRALEAIAKK